jgi:hypothetical protein
MADSRERNEQGRGQARDEHIDARRPVAPAGDQEGENQKRRNRQPPNPDVPEFGVEKNRCKCFPIQRVRPAIADGDGERIPPRERGEKRRHRDEEQRISQPVVERGANAFRKRLAGIKRKQRCSA